MRFGCFEVQPEARQLLVNGVPAKLGARAFDVLLALIERRDRVVGKNELLDLVWPGLIVEENNLQVHISALRKLLGPQAVATIPGRGYRFTVLLGADEALPAAAATSPAIPHGLPQQRTHFIGRERELTELRGMLAGGARLVTVTGAGGSGKTRLALQVAAGLVDNVRGGVIFVPLAPVQEPALVAATIALAAGVRELKELRDRDVLLVLDNFEHLLPAAAEVSRLLSLAPELKILVTSRARLRLSGEQEYALDPLPPADAAEFFLDRARAVRPDLRSDPAVGAICERLDGLPLALELAASRVKVLDPSLLLERLARSLPLLTGGARDAPERQRTLRATIEWSYALLEEPLQRAFHRLAVFPGSFPLEAAEVVARTDFDQITALVDWSLLKPIGEGRFLMLETIREFGRERLEGSSERDEVRDRHLEFFLQLVKRAEPKLTGPDQRQWYDRLAAENDNLRDALAYACDSRDGERALMLAGTIWRFWWNRGRIAEASLWYERAFAIGQDASPSARARGLFGMAHMVDAGGDFERARSLFEEAADVLRQIGDARWLVLALTHLAGTYAYLGDTRRAAAMNDEALDLADRSGDVRGAAVVRSNLGNSFMVSGDDRRAGALLERALEDYRSVGDTYGTATCLGNLAVIGLHDGEIEVAAAKLRESLELSSSIGDAHTLTGSLAAAAAVALARADPEAGARLGGAVSTACSTLGLALEPLEARLMSDTTAALRQALGGSFDDAWSAGAKMDLAAAVDLAVKKLGG
jgi:predicted ATPase/DNA-binding winged helix-turn-helix (wHTH) protein